MITKEEITLNDFLIPANFEDSGKIMGLFSTRNVVVIDRITKLQIYLMA